MFLMLSMLIFRSNSQTIMDSLINQPDFPMLIIRKNIYWTTIYTTGELQSKGWSIRIRGRHGRWKFYYKTGNLFCIGFYDNGKRIKEWTYFNEDGSIYKIINYPDN